MASAEYMREWRKRNKEHVAQYAREYFATEAGKAAKRGQQRRHYELRVKTDPVKMKANNERSKAWDLAHPEAHLARCTRWSRTHREELATKARERYNSLSIEDRHALREGRKEYQKQYRAAHRDELVAYAQRYFEANRDELVAYSRASYAKNKIAYIHRANKRRVLLVGTYTQDDIQRLYVGQRGQCAGCEKDLNEKYEIDHIMPLALDPEGDRLDNLQLLCRACNRHKSSKHPDEWRRRAAKSASV